MGRIIARDLHHVGFLVGNSSVVRMDITALETVYNPADTFGVKRGNRNNFI